MFKFWRRAFTYLFLVTVFFYSAVLVLAGKPANPVSETKPRNPDITLMERLRSVNPDASTVMLSFSGFGMAVPAPCLLAAHVEKDPKLASDRITQQIHQRFQSECELNNQVRSATYPIFMKIAESGKLPVDPFAFEILDTQNNWSVVGLFEELSICEAILMKATKAGLGIKPCFHWHPRY